VCNLVLSPDLGIDDKHTIRASFRAEQPEPDLRLLRSRSYTVPLQPDEMDIRGASNSQQN
jgi:hypothetical protein